MIFLGKEFDENETFNTTIKVNSVVSLVISSYTIQRALCKSCKVILNNIGNYHLYYARMLTQQDLHYFEKKVFDSSEDFKTSYFKHLNCIKKAIKNQEKALLTSNSEKLKQDYKYNKDQLKELEDPQVLIDLDNMIKLRMFA
jgi:hypothetical protein